MATIKPFYENVQAHYDLSNKFFALFLDPSMTYSCAYFERDDMSLEEAQQAKLELSLGKCDLEPGQRLLDIGCGWGSMPELAATEYGVSVVGLTLSEKQHQYAAARMTALPEGSGEARIRLQGWEEFDEPVDRIVTIGAFEHFRKERYEQFFVHSRKLLPDNGTMLVHTIIQPRLSDLRKQGIPVGREQLLFGRFLQTAIFPGSQIPAKDEVLSGAEKAGFKCEQVQALRPHYARTLDTWASNLESNRDEAVKITSEEVYDTYMHYLTGCAKLFHRGSNDVMQFTLKIR